MHGFEDVGQPAKQRGTHDGKQEKLAESHHDARDGQDGKSNRVGPVRGALKRCEALDLAAGLSAMQPNGALAKIKQRNGQSNNQQKRAAVWNQPVVAHLAPGLTRIGQAGTRVLHKRLDQIAGLRRFAFGQAAVTRDARTHLPPHRRVVAGLDFGALAIGLVGVAGQLIGIGFDFENVDTLDAARGWGHSGGGCRCRSGRCCRGCGLRQGDSRPAHHCEN